MYYIHSYWRCGVGSSSKVLVLVGSGRRLLNLATKSVHVKSSPPILKNIFWFLKREFSAPPLLREIYSLFF